MQVRNIHFCFTHSAEYPDELQIKTESCKMKLEKRSTQLQSCDAGMVAI
jgi:hypothetical protein